MAKTQQKPPVLTRKHLAGLERERYINRLILIGTGAVVLFVVALVAWTWLLDAVIYPNQTVAVVEGQEIKGREFMARARYNRQQLVTQFQQTYAEYQQLSQLFGDDPTFTQQYTGYLLQIQSQLEPQASGEFTVNQLVDDYLLRLEAEKMGVQVSPEEVDAEMQNLFGFYPNGTPTAEPFFTTAPTSTLSAQQYALVSATPTASITPTASNTPTSSATPQGAATQTSSPTAIPSAGASATPAPTATQFTREGYEQALADFFASYEEFVDVDEAVIRQVIESSLLREKMNELVNADLPRTQEQVWARHILVETEEEAQAVLERLDADEDWSALAAELSTDTSNKDTGGDLGWFPREQMVEPFANAAFELGIGEISQPVQSDFGWHIIQVLGHEHRPLSQSEYDQLKLQALDNLIQNLRNTYSWEIFDAWKAMSPDQPEIPPLQ